MIAEPKQRTSSLTDQGRPGIREGGEQTSWPPVGSLILGAWLLASPSAFGYTEPGLFWSDLICGALVMVLAGISVNPAQQWSRWGIAGLGAWLLFAPLVFWTKSAAAYNNDTLIGTLLITFSMVIPGPPGCKPLPGPERPPGWSYNPSDWVQRAPVIIMAFLGFFIARYLAAYQMGHIRTVCDPFFDDGTRRVLESKVSRAFPISDAGLGAISYLIEALTGFVGGRSRWRTMPWMVLFFGFLVVPLGVVSIVLVILQPLAVGAWCTLCLVTAVAMLLMISPAADEIVATVQFLGQSRRSGRPFWSAFWKGGTVPALEPTPSRPRAGGWPYQFAHASGLIGVPWNLAVAAGIGVWLMLSPAVFGLQGWAANTHYLAGALVITFTVIAWGEIARSARWLGVLLGAWFVVSPWFLGEMTAPGKWNDLVCGTALIVLSPRKGKLEEEFGSFNRWIL